MSDSKGFKVYEAINNVQAALAKIGIGKDRENAIQKFKFRGIDEVYNELAPLLAEHHLVILPRFSDRTVEWRATKNGGEMAHVCVKSTYLFASSEDGSTAEVSTFGEAMDSGDKATNKAMSASYKYAAVQAFCIPTEGSGDDPDAATPPPTQSQSKQQSKPAAVPADPSNESVQRENKLIDDAIGDIKKAKSSSDAYAFAKSLGLPETHPRRADVSKALKETRDRLLKPATPGAAA